VSVVVLVQLPGVSVAYNVSPEVEYTYNKIVEQATSDYIYHCTLCGHMIVIVMTNILFVRVSIWSKRVRLQIYESLQC